MARYLCKAEVSVRIEIAFDAELEYEAEFEGEVLACEPDMDEEHFIECLAQRSLEGTIEVEVEAEDKEEAERIAVEMIEDVERWNATGHVVGWEFASTCVDEVHVESLEIEEIE